MSASTSVVYVGIDCGTDGTGIAIGVGAGDSIYEHTDWPGGDSRTGSDRSKTRTAVLLSVEKKKEEKQQKKKEEETKEYIPIAFGDDAYNRYAELIQSSEKDNVQYLFFDYFKLALLVNDDKNLDKIPLIKAVTGEEVSANIVFTAAFKLIHQNVYKRLSLATCNTILPEHIVWTITVPTIFTECAKQIIRDAAKNAFPKDSKIKLALEPEAAALACRQQDSKSGLVFGSRFIVCDLGAGTADFSQLVVCHDGSIKETDMSSGGAWGGAFVERRLLALFLAVFGQDTMTKFQTSYPIEYNELLSNIRNLKHRITDDLTQTFYRLSLPYKFIEITRLQERLHSRKIFASSSTIELPITEPMLSAATIVPLLLDTHFLDVKNSSGYEEATATTATSTTETINAQLREFLDDKKTLKYSMGLLKLSRELIVSLFDDPVNAIIKHIDKILNKEIARKTTTTTLFLVGGFAQSPLVQTRINTYLAKQKMIHVVRTMPLHPALAVMHGAVKYGINPKIIAERIAKLTFAVNTMHTWDEKLHAGGVKTTRQFNGSARDYCESTLQIFCNAGDAIKVDQTCVHALRPISDWQQSMTIRVYATPQRNPQMTTDTGIYLIGFVTLETPFIHNKLISYEKARSLGTTTHLSRDQYYGNDRMFLVSMAFGTTEIEVVATESGSERKVRATINYNLPNQSQPLFIK